MTLGEYIRTFIKDDESMARAFAYLETKPESKDDEAMAKAIKKWGETLTMEVPDDPV